MKNNFSKQWDAGGGSRSIIQGLNLFTSRNLFKSLKSILMVVALLSLSSNVWGTTATWTLVEDAPTDWSGEYLIVYGTKCFNGSLSSGLDQHQGVDVTISNNSISLDDSYAMIVAKVDSKYSLQTAAGCYVGRNANSNGMDANTTWSSNYTVSFGSWNSTNKTVKISGNGGRALGNNSGPWRFYSSSNAYTNVKLFKKASSKKTVLFLELIFAHFYGIF